MVIQNISVSSKIKLSILKLKILLGLCRNFCKLSVVRNQDEIRLLDGPNQASHKLSLRKQAYPNTDITYLYTEYSYFINRTSFQQLLFTRTKRYKLEQKHYYCSPNLLQTKRINLETIRFMIQKYYRSTVLCADSLYSLVKYKVVLKGANCVLDAFLDQNTLHIIQTHYVTPSTPYNSKNIRLLGIKAFLIYQKTLRRLYHHVKQCKEIKITIQEFVTPIFKSLSVFANTFVFEKTSTLINLAELQIKNLSSEVLQKLKKIYVDLRYSKTFNTLQLIGKDCFSLALALAQFVIQLTLDTLEFKRSRRLYSKIVNKYQSIRTGYKEIKEQSQILSQQLFSEQEYRQRGAQFEDGDSRRRRLGSRLQRNLKSEDNLYNLRKISFGDQKEILEESENAAEDDYMVQGSKTIPQRATFSDNQDNGDKKLSSIREARMEESPTTQSVEMKEEKTPEVKVNETDEQLQQELHEPEYKEITVRSQSEELGPTVFTELVKPQQNTNISKEVQEAHQVHVQQEQYEEHTKEEPVAKQQEKPEEEQQGSTTMKAKKSKKHKKNRHY